MANIDVRGDRGYTVQLPFVCRATMAISSDSRDSDCDRNNVESCSGCRVSVSRYATTGGSRHHGYHLLCRHGCHLHCHHGCHLVITEAIYPVSMGVIFHVIAGTIFPVITGTNFAAFITRYTDPVITGTIDLPRRHANGNEATAASHVRDTVLLYIASIKRH